MHNDQEIALTWIPSWSPTDCRGLLWHLIWLQTSVWITDIQGRSQTSYTAPRNGIVSQKPYCWSPKMPCARDDGTAQDNYDVLWLVFSYPKPSHHPLGAVFSAISNKAYGAQIGGGLWVFADHTRNNKHKNKCVHDLRTSFGVFTLVNLHTQTAVDAGDIHTWKTMVILITRKTQRPPIWAACRDKNGVQVLGSPLDICGMDSFQSQPFETFKSGSEYIPSCKHHIQVSFLVVVCHLDVSWGRSPRKSATISSPYGPTKNTNNM